LTSTVDFLLTGYAHGIYDHSSCKPLLQDFFVSIPSFRVPLWCFAGS